VTTTNSIAAPEQPDALRRELNVFDGIAIAVGTIIGSAIFLIPSSIAAQMSSPLNVVAVWIVGGALSVFGALSLGELGSAYPRAGGIYVYLREAYGSLPAFLYGWCLFTMIHTGGGAALAVGFGVYASQVLDLGSTGQKVLSVAAIAFLTAINCLGLRPGKLVQNTLAIAKIGGLTTLAFLLYAFGNSHGLPRSNPGDLNLPLAVVPFGIALVAVLWAYEGWHLVSFAAGEMKNPKRDLPRSLLYGALIVAAIYILVNMSYYAVLTPAQIRSSPAVAATAMGQAYGTGASILISLLIMVCVFGSINGLILTGPRVYFAMARDGIFFSQFGKLNKFGTPYVAVVAQGLWMVVLALSGSYETLFTYVIFAAWIFYGLTVAAVIVLRRKRPDRDRPFQVPGYPYLPLLFCAAALGLAANMIVAGPERALVGIAMILTGVPVYFLFQRFRAKPAVVVKT
jgi:APA family basic amino acid/polyamine antiporter